jgi:hypothetical protein
LDVILAVDDDDDDDDDDEEEEEGDFSRLCFAGRGLPAHYLRSILGIC